MKLKAWPLVVPLAVLIVLAPALSSSGLAQQAPPAPSSKTTPELPPGPGREPFERICSGCHYTSVVTSERRTAESWANVVDDMRARGAIGSDEDMDKITAWLAANYPPKPAESK
jgi:mono/diheme cytochrome c family protein